MVSANRLSVGSKEELHPDSSRRAVSQHSQLLPIKYTTLLGSASREKFRDLLLNHLRPCRGRILGITYKNDMKLHKIAFNRIYRRNKAKPSQMMGYSVKVQAFLRRVVVADFLLIRGSEVDSV